MVTNLSVLTSRLSREGVDKNYNVLIPYAVSSENSLAYTNSVLPGWCPVGLLHTIITDKRGMQCGEVVTSDYNGDPGILLLVVNTRKLDIHRVICNVHEGGIHHLIVNCVLDSSTHSTSSCIEIVDEEDTHVSFPDDFSCLSVPFA
ncbi:hypothetical protein HAX54_041316 [Datura stramonium]|uniref:Uncharacterized protein n=1 Tax=Datura stramonium TaxID=4076 RepID=A0ABS8VQC8_DATST|nr:hypothetical protein [Datura stramonium]